MVEITTSNPINIPTNSSIKQIQNNSIPSESLSVSQKQNNLLSVSPKYQNIKNKLNQHEYTWKVFDKIGVG